MNTEKWTYTGDVNIEYGGMFLDLNEFEKSGDYCPAIKITNLDGAIGFEGALLIEIGDICCDERYKKAALETTGYEDRTDLTPIEIVESFEAYGGIERHGYNDEFTIQTIKGGNLSFENWQVDEDLSREFWESGQDISTFIQERFL